MGILIFSCFPGWREENKHPQLLQQEGNSPSRKLNTKHHLRVPLFILWSLRKTVQFSNQMSSTEHTWYSVFWWVQNLNAKGFNFIFLVTFQPKWTLNRITKNQIDQVISGLTEWTRTFTLTAFCGNQHFVSLGLQFSFSYI